MPLHALEGLVIGVTADRRWEEQAALLERRGASVVHAPTITTHYLAHDETLRAVTQGVIDHEPDYLVANTGIGMQTWFEAAQAWGLADALTGALAHTKIAARGLKAATVAHSHGLNIWTRAPNERLDEVLGMLQDEGIAGRTVVIQQDGSDTHEFPGALSAAGANVIEVPIYRWRLPDDPLPAQRLIEGVRDGRIHAITFTSAPAVHNLFTIAARDNADDELRRGFNRGVIAACVGAVCADGARREGIDAPLSPSVGRLGLLVRALSDHVATSRTTLRLAGKDVVIQGNLVGIDDATVQLSPREGGVLAVLVERPGAVVSRATLLQQVWGPGEHDAHALEMTIARLRTKLGPCRSALHTSPGRGYRLVPD